MLTELLQRSRLGSVVCLQVALDLDTLVYLSRMPRLSRLNFTLSITLSSDSPLVFSNLRHLTLDSQSLEPISCLLSQTWFPAITDFSAFIDNYPSQLELGSFMACIPMSNTGHPIKNLRFDQLSWPPDKVFRSAALLLHFEDLRPCMALSNLHYIEIDIECNMGLTDSQMLTLASAWPQLENL